MADTLLPGRSPVSPYNPTDMRGGARPGATGSYSPTTPGGTTSGAPQVPPPPGSYSPTSAPGTQAGGPPPGMKNPTWNPVYGVWMESAPGVYDSAPKSVLDTQANWEDSYGASFGASPVSGGAPSGNYQPGSASGGQPAGPAAPYNHTPPSGGGAPQIPPPPGTNSGGVPTVNMETGYATGVPQNQMNQVAVPKQFADMGVTPDMWQQLMRMWSSGYGGN